MKYGILLMILCAILFARVDSAIEKAMFFRIDKGSNSPLRFGIDGSEIVLRSTMKTANRDIMEFDIQVFVWGTMEGWAKSMHFGNVYAIFPLGIGKPSLKMGQQVVPFGLLAEYNTHGQLFQNPYALYLGERIDVGLSILGILGPIDYWYMVSNGNGLEMMEQNNDKVHTLRVAHRREMSFGEIKSGISLLHGILPEFMENPFWNMAAMPDTFVVKNRLGLDTEMSVLLFLLRAEFVTGKNGALGQFQNYPDEFMVASYLEARLALYSSIELMTMYSLYKPVISGSEKIYEAGIGFNFNPGDLKAINLRAGGFKRFSPHSATYSMALKMGIRI